MDAVFKHASEGPIPDARGPTGRCASSLMANVEPLPVGEAWPHGKLCEHRKEDPAAQVESVTGPHQPEALCARATVINLRMDM